MDLVPVFNEVLRKYNASPIEPSIFRLQDLNEFLKEAYRIHKHIAELTTYLRSIRQSYLSITPPSRRKNISRTDSSKSQLPTPDASKHLTDTQRTQIDAEAKQLLRELNAAVASLAEVESIRQTAERTIALKKRARGGLGALGRWATGGAVTAKSLEEEEEEAKENTLKMHREGVIWYLQQKLEQAGRVQGEMMEIRLTREVERSKSMLYKSQESVRMMDGMEKLGSLNSTTAGATHNPHKDSYPTHIEEMDRQSAMQQLSPEQLQLFAEENQDMLKHYEDRLDQVRQAERSLQDVAELHSTLTMNLAVQSEHIDKLVEDSEFATENVGGGNKQLKRASERKSTARLVFYSTTVFCASLILWDLFI
ncbi:hypothetical protein M501DRAFT_1007514 [Patellaria atrata CBS 101060]|uniref:t-SNARE coiled-coil homology domain-containing protein n=1 Tax=Patellaria atrata CBS 101060 TaxID=1346257 RepID=A0A9P4S4B2_9PEZI|nr:hypothetical protein M501DRAFT_1007514 [Patellaria atrata CBS 101060]